MACKFICGADAMRVAVAHEQSLPSRIQAYRFHQTALHSHETTIDSHETAIRSHETAIRLHRTAILSREKARIVDPNYRSIVAPGRQSPSKFPHQPLQPAVPTDINLLNFHRFLQLHPPPFTSQAAGASQIPLRLVRANKNAQPFACISSSAVLTL